MSFSLSIWIMGQRDIPLIPSSPMESMPPIHIMSRIIPREITEMRWVIDVGCLVDGYCADMTRTVFLGEATDQAKEIYRIVREAKPPGD